MDKKSSSKFKIFKAKEFDENYKELEKSDKNRVDKILNQLTDNGDITGKPLGMDFFREKKFGGKRLYYLVYKKVFVILVVSISNKKAQQATINEIIKNLAEYQQSVFETLKKEGLI
ncbi:MAG TPA: hypothetical protein VFF13_05015 [archaeon]|nr:hypothetical protein [archaeon]